MDSTNNNNNNNTGSPSTHRYNTRLKLHNTESHNNVTPNCEKRNANFRIMSSHGNPPNEPKEQNPLDIA